MDVYAFVASLIVLAIVGYHIKVSDKRRRMKNIASNHKILSSEIIFEFSMTGECRAGVAKRAMLASMYHDAMAERAERSPGMYWREIAVMHDLGRSRVEPVSPWRCGVLVRSGSAWIGLHWSPRNRRACINVIPFVTFWFTLPGGDAP